MILYIILLIVIFILLYNKINKLEGFEQDLTDKVKSKKCLIVYYGGAFRDGNIGTTKHDTIYGYEAQERASITHSKLKKVLNKKGYQTDILINTRTTKYTHKLEDWYSPFNMIINNLSERIHGKDFMIQSAIRNINKLDKNNYNFILFIRIDLFLKPEFYNVLDTESDKINFLANNYNTDNCVTIEKRNPVIVDLFLYIPKKYYYILDRNFNLNHNSWFYYKIKYKLTDDDLAFMTNKIFDSNSYREYNEYYIMSSRKENKNVHKNNNKCIPFNKNNNIFLDNPTEHYINKHKNFYNE
jgi:hypothetical protein